MFSCLLNKNRKNFHHSASGAIVASEVTSDPRFQFLYLNHRWLMCFSMPLFIHWIEKKLIVVRLSTTGENIWRMKQMIVFVVSMFFQIVFRQFLIPLHILHLLHADKYEQNRDMSWVLRCGQKETRRHWPYRLPSDWAFDSHFGCLQGRGAL